MIAKLHPNDQPKPIIALDGDGVLLDYHLAYQLVWQKAFGILPEIKDPMAYWPKDRYDVRHLDSTDLTTFAVSLITIIGAVFPNRECNRCMSSVSRWWL